MAYSYTSENGQVKKYAAEFLADKIVDIENLPTDVRPGSSCLCLENSSIYILNNEKTWQKL
jgi:hypothetical protein